MHAPERYRELLDAFRAAHSEFKDVPFSLRVCHWADPPRRIPDEPWNEFLKNCVMVLDKSPGDVMPVGTVSFPVVDPRWLSYALASNPRTNEQMARECGDEIMRVCWRSCIVYAKTFKAEQQQAAESFIKLAEAAGTTLPLSIREALPQQANIADAESNTYLDRWLDLMFWSTPPELEELLTLNQWGGGRDLFWQPFSNAADAIERCRLSSNAPIFATKGNRWPRWAGQIPKSFLHAEAVNGSTPAPMAEARFSWKVDSDSFVIRFDDETGRFLKSWIGFRRYRQLLQSRDGRVSMAELYGSKSDQRVTNDLDRSAIWSVDEKGLKAIDQKRIEFVAEQEEARKAGDMDSVAECEEKIKQIDDWLKKNTRLKKQADRTPRRVARNISDPFASMRSTIWDSFDEARKRMIDGGMPKLAQHLEPGIIGSEGGDFNYSQSAAVPWEFE